MNRRSYHFIVCSHELWFIFWNLLFLLTRTTALFCSTLVSLIMTRMKLVTAVIIAPMCTTLLRLTQIIMGRVTHVLWILMEMVCFQFWELSTVPQVHFALCPVICVTCFYTWNKIVSSSSKMQKKGKTGSSVLCSVVVHKVPKGLQWILFKYKSQQVFYQCNLKKNSFLHLCSKVIRV